MHSVHSVEEKLYSFATLSFCIPYPSVLRSILMWHNSFPLGLKRCFFVAFKAYQSVLSGARNLTSHYLIKVFRHPTSCYCSIEDYRRDINNQITFWLFIYILPLNHIWWRRIEVWIIFWNIIGWEHQRLHLYFAAHRQFGKCFPVVYTSVVILTDQSFKGEDCNQSSKAWRMTVTADSRKAIWNFSKKAALDSTSSSYTGSGVVVVTFKPLDFKKR